MFSVPAWFDREPKRWDRELEAMRAFPGFVPGGRVFPSAYKSWRGSIQPFGPESDVGQIASHLKLQKALSVRRDGRLEPTCLIPTSADITNLSQLQTAFEIEIIYLEPPHIPRIFALKPRIDLRIFRDHPHLSRYRPHPFHAFNMSYPDSDLCVFATQDDVWLWEQEQHTAADIVEYTAFWLAAHLLWVASGRQKWPMPEASHDPLTLLLTTPPQAQCSCGSGKEFKDCCSSFCIKTLIEKRSILDPIDYRWVGREVPRELFR